MLQAVHRGDHGKATDELGNEAVLDEIVGDNVVEESVGVAVLLRVFSALKPDRVGSDAALDDLFEFGERAAADEQDVRRVDRQEFLVRVRLRPPCGGTDATVPSSILRSACWTPSPETSRVIDGLSALRAILSTSSM